MSRSTPSPTSLGARVRQPPGLGQLRRLRVSAASSNSARSRSAPIADEVERRASSPSCARAVGVDRARPRAAPAARRGRARRTVRARRLAGAIDGQAAGAVGHDTPVATARARAPAPTAAANEANASASVSGRARGHRRDRLPSSRSSSSGVGGGDASGGSRTRPGRSRSRSIHCVHAVGAVAPAATNRVSSRSGARTSTGASRLVRLEERADQHAHRQRRSAGRRSSTSCRRRLPARRSARPSACDRSDSRPAAPRARPSAWPAPRAAPAKPKNVMSVPIVPVNVGSIARRRRGRRLGSGGVPVRSRRVEIDDRRRVAAEQRRAERHDRFRRRGRPARAPALPSAAASGHVLIGSDVELVRRRAARTCAAATSA